MNEVPSVLNIFWAFTFSLALYVYSSLVIMFIAQKTKTTPAWLAWIPLVNVFLMLKVAKLSYWWILLLFVPFVNMIVAIYLWWKIAEARGKQGWIGILMLVPFVNFIALGYLGFSE